MVGNKIPKVIHYCWFGGGEIPLYLQNCIDSWKRVMPDYKLRLWNESCFDVNSIPFIKEASEAKKWAFVADYIRLFALFTEGGIYLDTDVKVFKPFDEFLNYSFFTSHEIHPGNFTELEQSKLNEEFIPKNKNEYIYGLNILAAAMGSIKGHSFIKECLEFYDDKHFFGRNGEILSVEFIIGPYMSKKAEEYGYKYHNSQQILKNNMIILKPEILVGNSVFLTKESYAIHLCNGSWKEKTILENVEYKIRNEYPNIYPFVALSTKVVRKIQHFFKKL